MDQAKQPSKRAFILYIRYSPNITQKTHAKFSWHIPLQAAHTLSKTSLPCFNCTKFSSVPLLCQTLCQNCLHFDLPSFITHIKPNPHHRQRVLVTYVSVNLPRINFQISKFGGPISHRKKCTYVMLSCVRRSALAKRYARQGKQTPSLT